MSSSLSYGYLLHIQLQLFVTIKSNYLESYIQLSWDHTCDHYLLHQGKSVWDIDPVAIWDILLLGLGIAVMRPYDPTITTPGKVQLLCCFNTIHMSCFNTIHLLLHHINPDRTTITTPGKVQLLCWIYDSKRPVSSTPGKLWNSAQMVWDIDPVAICEFIPVLWLFTTPYT